MNSSTNTPEIPTPSGVATHLSEDSLVVITWVGAGLGVIFTVLRLAIRLSVMGRLLPDDYFILLALSFLIANAVLQTLQAPHLYYITFTPTGTDIVHHALMYTRYMFAIIGIFWSVLWSVKAAFLALFWAMTDHLPHYRRWWWAIVVFASGAYAGCWFASAWTCHPPSTYFQFAKCTKDIDKRGAVISIVYSTVVDILTDVMIMGFALSIVWSTTISFHQKVGLGAVFSLGAIIIAFAIVRAINITGRSYSDQAGLAVWGIAESSVSVIVGCLPPFKTFLSRSNSSYVSRSLPSYSRYRQKRSTQTTTTTSSDIPLQSILREPAGPVPKGEIRVTQGFGVIREERERGQDS
ncbi:hypothetical protein BDW74DRAFT_183325 [Aspergillus multicolor]|uniref:uncharacterized protein n=1 Tax=Aspergillus multicolor TaxID=41759 RepID=UPI003CCE2417